MAKAKDAEANNSYSSSSIRLREKERVLRADEMHVTRKTSFLMSNVK